MGRTGRRPGTAGDARGAILAAARSSFAERGYDATTLRGIARDAGVDPSLVHHYWPGGKDAVFVEALQLPVDPDLVIPAVLAGPPDGLGERLVRFFLGLWESPHSREPLLAVVRSAVTTEAAASLLRGFITRQDAGRVADGRAGGGPLRRAGRAARLRAPRDHRRVGRPYGAALPHRNP